MPLPTAKVFSANFLAVPTPPKFSPAKVLRSTVVLDSKEIVDRAAVDTIQNVRPKQQFQDFIKECLVEKSESVDDVIHRNKLKLFLSQAKINSS